MWSRHEKILLIHKLIDNIYDYFSSMLPIYAVWMLICYCAPGHFHDPATAVSIILLALMMLFIVFIPKLYTINQQMKLEDSKDIFYR